MRIARGLAPTLYLSLTLSHFRSILNLDSAEFANNSRTKSLFVSSVKEKNTLMKKDRANTPLTLHPEEWKFSIDNPQLCPTS